MIKKGEMLCAWTPDADPKNIAKLVGIVTSAENQVFIRTPYYRTPPTIF